MALLYEKYTKQEAEQLLKGIRKRSVLRVRVGCLLATLAVAAFFLGWPWILQLVLLVVAAGCLVWAWWLVDFGRLIRADVDETCS